MTSIPPPLDGTLPTVVDLLDFHAKYNADQPYHVFPSPASPDQVFSISFGELAQASHRAAHKFRPGRHGRDGEVVGLLLHTDALLYAAIMFGLCRADLVPYPMSPRNSPEAVCHMLEATNCRRIISHAAVSALVEKVRAIMEKKGESLRVEELPSLFEFYPALARFVSNGVYANGHVDLGPYPPTKLPLDWSRTALYIHSSGSTGLPKSRGWNLQNVLELFTHGFNLWGYNRQLKVGAMALPSFHGMGFVVQLCYPLSSSKAVATYTPQYPNPPVVPHPQNVYEVARITGCDVVYSVPAFVETWSHSQETIDYLKTLDAVIYGGGPLSQRVGDLMIENGVKLVCAYGGTEFCVPTVVGNPRDPKAPLQPNPHWAWLRFSDDAIIRMDPQGDGTYELVVVETDKFHVVVYNVEGEKAYATADLFVPHPTEPGYWKIVGRKDDVITLSTGEKIVPLAQEGRIGADSRVSGALMFGRQREQAGILIEPKAEYVFDPANEAALVAFRSQIWPAVEAANALAPEFGRIFKEMIIVTHPNKPFPRAAKGTIVRKQALAMYADEIEHLYKTISDSSNTQGVAPPKSWTAGDLEGWLVEHATSINEGRVPLMDISLFQQGFDSLSSTFFRNRIVGGLRASGDASVQQAVKGISSNFVFEHPTIEQLATALERLIDPSSEAAQAASYRSAIREVEEMIAKYCANMPRQKSPRGSLTGVAVLLTGSTGNIGSHILAHLLADERITKVYALNRPSASAEDRLQAAFADRGLPLELLKQDKLVSLAGDVTQPNFGLESAQYQVLLSGVTHIIHNAWTVNFNHRLSFFESQVAGVRKLVDICASLDRTVKLLCTSSIGIANKWDITRGAVPEQPLHEPELAAEPGYVAGKYVVEHILLNAAENGVSAMSVRMGQACGPKSTGAWGTAEYIPSIIKSSVALGSLPQMSGPVNWVPMDAIGQMYIDWLLADEELPNLVNVVHPRPTTWDVVFRGIEEELGYKLPVVSMDAWVDKLEARAVDATAEDIDNIPAIKLLDFFIGLRDHSAVAQNSEYAEADAGITFDTAALERSSEAMRTLEPMTEENARMWMRYWKGKGFIKDNTMRA